MSNDKAIEKHLDDMLRALQDQIAREKAAKEITDKVRKIVGDPVPAPKQMPLPIKVQPEPPPDKIAIDPWSQ